MKFPEGLGREFLCEVGLPDNAIEDASEAAIVRAKQRVEAGSRLFRAPSLTHRVVHGSHVIMTTAADVLCRRNRRDEFPPQLSVVEKERTPSVAECRRFHIPLLEKRRQGSAVNRQPDLVRARQPVNRLAPGELLRVLSPDFVDQQQ